ncbi:acyl carrier protein [Agrobacterium tumefaciens]|uniref:Acyl carrier protein n=1 Tax=Agrobacterium tumefaciens TaxID=358 RepID=A0AAJ4N070_AGRTU|nr:acyl carrier protein [Agrobacterium tumefaciens]
MADNNVFERIKNTMVNCQQFPADLITADATIEILGGDSLDDIELSLLLEEEFNIDIHDGTFDVNTPISDIAKAIEGIIANG